MDKDTLIRKIKSIENIDITQKDIINIFKKEIYEPNRLKNINKHDIIKKYDGYYVYYMYSGDELYYIGITKNIYNRMSCHFNPFTLKKEKWKFELTHIICYEYNSYEEISKIETKEFLNRIPKYNKIDYYYYSDENFIIPKETNKIIITVFPHINKDNLKFQFDDDYLKLKLKTNKVDIFNYLKKIIEENEEENEIYLTEKLCNGNIFKTIENMMNFVRDNIIELNKLTLPLQFEFKIKEDIRPYVIKINRTEINSEELIQYDNSRCKILNNFVILKNENIKEIKIKDFKSRFKIGDKTFSSNFSKFEELLKDFGVYKIGYSLLIIK